MSTEERGNDQKSIREAIEKNFDHHVARIQSAVRQPSVSVEHRGLREIAELFRDYLEDIGCDEATLVETDGAPGVWGYYDADAEKTIANYGMLDTRPVSDESAWDHDPFGGEIEDRDPYGRVLYGRGSVKVKGAYAAWLNALEATKEALGELPVNVMFLLEAEEINGSPHYYEMLDQYEDRLAEAEACLCPLAGQNANGDVSASLGYKAALYFTLQASGESWGRGPKGGSVHAMSNVVVDSPAWRLVDALSSLASENGTHIDIDGYYNQYEPPSEAERQEVREFIDSLDGEEDLWQSLPGLSRGDGHVDVLKEDLHENTEEAFFQYFYGPESFNIQGLYSGFLGAGTNTKPFTLPGEATAKFDLRMPRGYDPDVTLSQIRSHLDENGFEDVDIDVSGKHPSCDTDRDSDLVHAVTDAIESHGSELVLWPFSSGGVPWAAFGDQFGIPVLYGVGLGYGGNSSGANEFFVLDGNEDVAGLVGCELSHAEMLLEYADA